MTENIELGNNGQSQFFCFGDDPLQLFLVQCFILPAEERGRLKGKHAPGLQHHIVVLAVSSIPDGAFDLILLILREPAHMERTECHGGFVFNGAAGQLIGIEAQDAPFFFGKLTQCFQRIQHAIPVGSGDRDRIFHDLHPVRPAPAGAGGDFVADGGGAIPEEPDDLFDPFRFFRRIDHKICSAVQTADLVPVQFKTDRPGIHPGHQDLMFSVGHGVILFGYALMLTG